MRNSCSDQSIIRVYITETKEVFEFRNGQKKKRIAISLHTENVWLCLQKTGKPKIRISSSN